MGGLALQLRLPVKLEASAHCRGSRSEEGDLRHRTDHELIKICNKVKQFTNIKTSLRQPRYFASIYKRFNLQTAKDTSQTATEDGFHSGYNWISDSHGVNVSHQTDGILHQVFVLLWRGTAPRNRQQPEALQSSSGRCSPGEGVHRDQARDCKGMSLFLAISSPLFS